MYPSWLLCWHPHEGIFGIPPPWVKILRTKIRLFISKILSLLHVMSLQWVEVWSDAGSVQVWIVWEGTEGPSHHHLWTQQLLGADWTTRRPSLSPVFKDMQNSTSSTASSGWTHRHGRKQQTPAHWKHTRQKEQTRWGFPDIYTFMISDEGIADKTGVGNLFSWQSHTQIVIQGLS